MAINFPFPASAGTKHTEAGLTWVYDGVKWTTESTPIDLPWTRDAATDTINPTNSGDDVTADNATFAGDATMTSQNSGPLAGLRNQIINGYFGVWQRGGSFSLNSNVSFTSDRWACNAPDGLTTAASISVVAPVAAGFMYAIKNTGSNFMALQQGVELARAESNMQFYVGSQWTLSFWSDEDQTSNPANVKFKNGLGDLSNTALPVSSSFPNFQSTGETANGYTRYSATFTITANASTVANADCLAVILSVGAGQSVTGIQLEPGPVATPFEHRPYAAELALCQRYYVAVTGVFIALTRAQQASTATPKSCYANVFPPVTLRTAPTVTSTINTGTLVGTAARAEVIRFEASVNTSNSASVTAYTADAEL